MKFWLNIPKHPVFEYVALNANEMLLPEKRAELQELRSGISSANKHSTINTNLLSLQKTYCFKVSHLIVFCIINSRL